MDIREYQRYVQIIGANNPVIEEFATLNAGAKPLLHFDGYLYVGSEDPNTVDRVQISSGNLGSLVNNDGTYPILCSQGHLAYGVRLSGVINEIDLNTGTVKAKTTGSSDYASFGIVRNDGFLYVVDLSNNKIMSVNISDGTTAEFVQMPVLGTLLDSSANALYYSGVDSNLYTIQIGSRAIAVLSDSLPPTIYGQFYGSYLYATKSSGEVYRVNKTTGETTLYFDMERVTNDIVVIDNTTAYIVSFEAPDMRIFKVTYIF